jgi:hypothetical protein
VQRKGSRSNRKDRNNLGEKYYDTGGSLIHHLVYGDDWEVFILIDSLRR